MKHPSNLGTIGNRTRVPEVGNTARYQLSQAPGLCHWRSLTVNITMKFTFNWWDNTGVVAIFKVGRGQPMQKPGKAKMGLKSGGARPPVPTPMVKEAFDLCFFFNHTYQTPKVQYTYCLTPNITARSKSQRLAMVYLNCSWYIWQLKQCIRRRQVTTKYPVSEWISSTTPHQHHIGLLEADYIFKKGGADRNFKVIS